VSRSGGHGTRSFCALTGSSSTHTTRLQQAPLATVTTPTPSAHGIWRRAPVNRTWHVQASGLSFPRPLWLQSKAVLTISVGSFVLVYYQYTIFTLSFVSQVSKCSPHHCPNSHAKALPSSKEAETSPAVSCRISKPVAGQGHCQTVPGICSHTRHTVKELPTGAQPKEEDSRQP